MARTNDDGRGSPELVLDRAQVREVDRSAIEDFGIPGIILMEHASQGLAEHALMMLKSNADSQPPRVLIVCGKGNNGGDGYALARHLTNEGVHITLIPIGQPRPDSDAGVNAAICHQMGIETAGLDDIESPEEYALIVDALFGTGLDRGLEGKAADTVDWINASGRPVLAVDVPSGLDSDTGQPLGPTVKADLTVTFVAIKTGFLTKPAPDYLGRVVVADIGAPRMLLDRIQNKDRT